jgi:hypothetical protein
VFSFILDAATGCPFWEYLLTGTHFPDHPSGETGDETRKRKPGRGFPHRIASLWSGEDLRKRYLSALDELE